MTCSQMVSYCVQLQDIHSHGLDSYTWWFGWIHWVHYSITSFSMTRFAMDFHLLILWHNTCEYWFVQYLLTWFLLIDPLCITSWLWSIFGMDPQCINFHGHDHYSYISHGFVVYLNCWPWLLLLLSMGMPALRRENFDLLCCILLPIASVWWLLLGMPCIYF